MSCRFDRSIGAETCDKVDRSLFETIEPALERNPALNIEFDLSKTDFVGSAFLRLCIRYCKKVGRDRFLVRGTNVNVKHVFEISGLSELIKIVPAGPDS